MDLYRNLLKNVISSFINRNRRGIRAETVIILASVLGGRDNYNSCPVSLHLPKLKKSKKRRREKPCPKSGE